ncbi:MAG: mucoidy inhibitor MuiA family protein [Candidatus Glassbacteria bacterium]
MKSFTVIFLSCLVASGYYFVPGFVLADNIDSHITSVTVYHGRALVTRLARVDVTTGQQSFEFMKLPGNINSESIRTSVKGSAEAEIIGVESRTIELTEFHDGRIQGIQAQLDSVELELMTLTDEQWILKKELEFMDSIQFRSTEEAVREVSRDKPTVHDWRSVIEFLDSKREAAKRRQRELSVRVKALEALKKKLEREKNALVKSKVQKEKVVSVKLSVTSPGWLEISLSYLVPNANWNQSYDVKAMAGSNELQMTYYAEVTQTTGEDWTDVMLALSTAKPSASASVPGIEPVYLDQPRRAEIKKGIQTMTKAEALPKTGTLGPSDQRGKPQGERPAPPVTAEVEPHLTAASFRIPVTETIPADGSSHRAVIAIIPLEAEFHFESVPRVTEHTYLTAEVRNTSSYPLLRGPVSIFLDGGYIGRSGIDDVIPGEEFAIDLGIDEAVSVEFELVSRNVSYHGRGQKRQRDNYHYRINVENHKDDEVEVTLTDRIPVSRHEEIEVKNIEIIPVPSEQSEQGILTWHLVIPSAEVKTIDLAYSIEFQRGMRPVELYR